MKLQWIAAAAAVAAAFVMAATAYADGANLLEGYEKAEWQGDSLSLDSGSGALFFVSDGGEKTALLEITAQGTGIYFSVDAGNGVNTSDSGYCTVEFCGEDGQALSSLSTGSIKGLENYTRFYIGSEGRYYPLPEGTEKIVVSLHAAPDGRSGTAKVYFRNLMLYLSSEKPLTEPKDDPYMNSIAGLTKVEAGLDPWIRWIWVGVVFAVAMAFYFVRRRRDRYKTAEVMKTGKRKL